MSVKATHLAVDIDRAAWGVPGQPEPTAPIIDDATLGVWALLEAAADNDRASSRVNVRFVDEPGERGVSLLEVERDCRPSEIVDLRDALFSLRIQIVNAVTGPLRKRVERLRVVEFDGAAISRRRQRELCAALVAHLDGTAPPRTQRIEHEPKDRPEPRATPAPSGPARLRKA